MNNVSKFQMHPYLQEIQVVGKGRIILDLTETEHTQTFYDYELSYE